MGATVRRQSFFSMGGFGEEIEVDMKALYRLAGADKPRIEVLTPPKRHDLQNPWPRMSNMWGTIYQDEFPPWI